MIDSDNEGTGEHFFEYDIRLWDHKIPAKKVVEQRLNPAYVPPPPVAEGAEAVTPYRFLPKDKCAKLKFDHMV